MNKIELSKRLSAICDMVYPSEAVADIGTDHGYLPIWLVQNGISPYAIASDINIGPINIARANISAYGLDDKIQTFLSDGLKSIDLTDIDTLVIAGMGGELIVDILEHSSQKLESVSAIILSPHTKIEAVRKWVKSSEFISIKEDMVYEDGKYYLIIRLERKAPHLGEDDLCASKSSDDSKRLDDSKSLDDSKCFDDSKNAYDSKSTKDSILIKYESICIDNPKRVSENISHNISEKISDRYGNILIRNRHPVFLEFLKHRHDVLMKIKNQMLVHGVDEVKQREIEEEIQIIREVQYEMQRDI